ncbi:hypothetical protein SAMN04488120_10325 [Fontimonas thermophila]|uniref:Alginate export n=1 Tax=Fontimonas thermophila TaxID=1076937 RepID=A0A1I2I6C2_9GAMM|nr:hypothetical protein [Fontimonas thermophila]SFF37198.1 hypothetical protein SAMN04488120_10325 [Fontimonas thermophila]
MRRWRRAPVLLVFCAAVATAPPPARPAAADPPAPGGKSRPLHLQYSTRLGEVRRPGDKPALRQDTQGDEPLDLNRQSGLAPVRPVQAWTATRDAPVPDRWRILDGLGLMRENLFDPYNQNTLKGDKPVRGSDEFFVLTLIADTVWEPRQVPTPVGNQATSRPGSLDIFGGPDQQVLAQTLTLGLAYLKGNTVFRPPDYELRFTPAFNFNQVRVDEAGALRIDPRRDSRLRRETFTGVQELFADVHLRDVSVRYDFDSVRVGIQPIALDFRGFLFQDLPLAVRLFGTRDNNRWQYNLLWARRLEKDTNSGLNALDRALRQDDVLAANLYRQDFPVLGFTSQLLLALNDNREDEKPFYNTNGFIERPASLGTEKPRRYRVTYLGYNGDGHFGRTNLTVSAYLALGRESRGVFSDAPRRIRAGFAAAEASWDFNWTRIRASALWGSADRNPYDDSANGFDAIVENPLIAGADTSYWIRQSVPLIGGGVVALSNRNGVLNALRSSVQHGQSNFANPGVVLLGLGTDLDLLPTLRLSTNANHLWFGDTTVLEVARNQGDIDRAIGWDLSASLIWRPLMNQNVVLRLSYAELLPGAGFRALFPDQSAYSVLANLTLTY